MMKNFTLFISKGKENKRLALLLFLFLFPVLLTHGQQFTVATTPSFSFNNGSGVTTFNFQNTNPFPITIDNIFTGIYSGSGTYTFYLWYNLTPVNGNPGQAIPNAPGWVLAAQNTLNIPSASTQYQVITNAGLTIPPNTTVGMAVGGFDSGGSGAMGYYTIPSTIVYTFAGGGCNIISGLNVGYSSTTYSAAPSFYPRGFVGSIQFSQAIPPDDAGVAALTSPSSAGNFCPGTDTVRVRVENYGGVNLSNVDLDWSLNGVSQGQQQLTFNPPLAPNQSQIVTLGAVNFTNNPAQIRAWTSSPNGNNDSDNGNDTLTVSLGANYMVPVVDISPGDTAFCQGGSVTLNHGNTDNNISVLWNTGSTADDLTVTTSGQYSVTVTSQQGCSASDAVNVLVNLLPTVDLGNDTNYCVGSSYTLQSGNINPNINVLWSDGSTGNDLVVNDSGQYYVTLTAPGGCTASDTINIDVASNPVIDLGNDVAFCEGGSHLIQSGNTDSTATVAWNTGAVSNDLIVANSGNYVCVITNQHGCSVSDSVNITVNPLPVILGLSETQNPDGSFTYLAVGVQGGVSYLWTFSDGSTSTDVSPTHTYPSGDGIYSVTLVVENECGSTTYTMNTDNNPDTDYVDEDPIDDDEGGSVGLTSAELEELLIYPNPVREFLNIESPVTIKSISIYNTLGHTVYHSVIPSNKQQIYVNEFSNGLYFINISMENGQRFSRKIEVVK